jgi:hypothetical protein
MEYMQHALKVECPQLQVRFNITGLRQPMLDGPKKRKYATGQFKKMAVTVMKEANISIEAVTPQNTVVLTFGDAFTAWSYEFAGELATIRRDLFKILKYNKHLLAWSSKILKAPALEHGFIDVHLRAEKDWPNRMGAASDQVRLYIDEMEKYRGTLHRTIGQSMSAVGARKDSRVQRIINSFGVPGTRKVEYSSK